MMNVDNKDVFAAVDPAELSSKYKGRFLVKVLSQLAEELELEITNISNGWICILKSKDGSKQCMVTGCAFPLNNQSAANLALDKCSASAVFSHDKVPHVPHNLVFGPTVQYSMAVKSRMTTGTLGPLLKMLEDHPVGLVMKPKDGNSGRNVILAKSPLEIEAGWLQLLQGGARDFAVCPFFHLDREWRLMLLDEELYVCYAKVRHGSEWRHNVSLGATTTTEVEIDLIAKSLLPLARRAISSLGLRFASVDIVQLDLSRCSDAERSYADGDGFMVMEINSAVFADGFVKQHPDAFSNCYTMFRKALQLSLK
mmetsp:Transcript_22062/g.43395  ORF Transcript_22062/g.43395 Transcript_22062/m.43395 type:complete len:311 (+) Transcript_22062:150-1082(+)